MHEKKAKGDIGVAFVIARLVELGWNVGIPLTEHAPYDLFAEKGGELHTVQVRYVAPREDVIYVKLSTSWADRNGNHRRRRSAGQFSLLAIYSPGRGVFFLKDSELGDNGQCVCLRFSPAKNNQRCGVRMAENFRFP